MMTTNVQIAFLLAGILGVIDLSVGQYSPACTEIQGCTTKAYSRAIKSGDKDALCRESKKMLECMEPKINECLPTVPETYKTVFLNIKDDVNKKIEANGCAEKKDKNNSDPSPACDKIASSCINDDRMKAAQNKGKEALCGELQNVVDCMNPLLEKCLPTVSEEWKIKWTEQRDSMVSSMGAGCADVKVEKGKPSVVTLTGKPSVVTPTESVNKCNFDMCQGKEGCEMYKCVNKVKGECDDEKIWEKMYTEPFKTNYDDLANDKTCGCGNLKPSLLIILATALLMFLRSHC